jgi:hypothetical protein
VDNSIGDSSFPEYDGVVSDRLVERAEEGTLGGGDERFGFLVLIGFLDRSAFIRMLCQEKQADSEDPDD